MFVLIGSILTNQRYEVLIYEREPGGYLIIDKLQITPPKLCFQTGYLGFKNGDPGKVRCIYLDEIFTDD